MALGQFDPGLSRLLLGWTTGQHRVTSKLYRFQHIDSLLPPLAFFFLAAKQPDAFLKKQGRIHGYPSRVRVGRSSAGEGH